MVTSDVQGLADHPIADDPRALGLPRAPRMAVWMGRPQGRYDTAGAS